MVMAGGAVQGYGPRDEIISQLMGPRIVSPEAPASSAGESITDSSANSPLRVMAQLSPGVSR
jgi:hypothetical protein